MNRITSATDRSYREFDTGISDNLRERNNLHRLLSERVEEEELKEEVVMKLGEMGFLNETEVSFGLDILRRVGECPICFNRVNLFENIIVLHCAHFLCKDCFRAVKQARHLDCPICREAFNDDDLDKME